MCAYQLYYKYSKLYLNSSISSIGYKYRLTPFSKIVDVLFPIIDIDKKQKPDLSPASTIKQNFADEEKEKNNNKKRQI